MTVGQLHHAQNFPGMLREIGCNGMIDYSHPENAPLVKVTQKAGLSLRVKSERLPWHQVWTILEKEFDLTILELYLLQCSLEQRDKEIHFFVTFDSTATLQNAA